MNWNEFRKTTLPRLNLQIASDDEFTFLSAKNVPFSHSVVYVFWRARDLYPTFQEVVTLARQLRKFQGQTFNYTGNSGPVGYYLSDDYQLTEFEVEVETSYGV